MSVIISQYIHAAYITDGQCFKVMMVLAICSEKPIAVNTINTAIFMRKYIFSIYMMV